ISQFLCGLTTKQDQFYSRTSLKNALSAINRHLQNVKPGWRYNLHDKNNFLDLYARFDGAARGGEHANLHVSQVVDTSDEGTAGPNSDIRKYLSFRPKNFPSSSFYLSACHSPD
ncbi:27425_t:CDS:2, partial [Racocetra persica]